MIHEYLYKADFAPMVAETETKIRLTSYCRPLTHALNDDGKRWAVLVLPGGGYQVTASKESEPVALAYFGAGLQAFVLKYSLKPAGFPQQLLEVCAAVAYIRKNAEKYRIDPNKILVTGHSAGGHLATQLANFWSHPELSAKIGLKPEDIRPNAVILSYAVTGPEGKGCIATQQSLFGDDFDKLPKEMLWLDQSINENNPPTFIWATATDDCVPVNNSLRYYQALLANGIDAELHIFRNGPHALGLADRESAYKPEQCLSCVSEWHHLALNWLHSLE